MENEYQNTVEQLASSEMQKATTSRVRVGDLGAPVTFGSVDPRSHRRKNKKMVHLHDLASCQGPVQDELF
jgi:hypothetical protein